MSENSKESSWKFLQVSKLLTAPWNYKTDDGALDSKLEASIKKSGFVQNLIVRPLGEGFEVVNGNHRLKVLRALGIEEVMCFNLGPISEVDAKRIAVETNEISYESDPDRLTEILKDIRSSMGIDQMVSTLPYEASDLASILGPAQEVKLSDEPFVMEGESVPEFAPGTSEDQHSLDEVKGKQRMCPSCGFEFS